MDQNWYVLAVQPRKEVYVEHQLRSAGEVVTCPRYVKTVRHARRTKRVPSPLFPGYLFVQLDLKTHNWRKVNSIPGSMGLVKFNNRPSPLGLPFVESVISKIGRDGIVSFEQKLRLGDSVQAVGGPFDRLFGRVIEMSESDRVKVLMDALNRKVEITLPKMAVIAAA